MLDSPKIYDYWNDEVFTYTESITKVLSGFDVETLSLGKFSGELKTAFDQLGASLVKERGSILTEAVEAADNYRDRAFIALRTYIEACSFRRNEAFNAAAAPLIRTIHKYGWGLQTQGYAIESSKMDNLIDDLEKMTENADALAAISAGPWLAEMKEEHEAFKQAVSDRDNEQAGRNPIKTIDARKAVIAAINDLFGAIEFLYKMNEDEQYKSMALKINEVTARMNATVKGRKTRNDSDQTPPADASSDE
ncbi:DUF6261 family protein [Prolixibacter sp. NT017]|uniref:DUF6261 family protein n=1 Tax=Prolixibacter sp. NT017 TaxID=2652390 RepID=UPI00126CAB90|nr:DUF6261 family protein [Prolixibacter sp. NT017]GET26670.1 hypothetical protein NT017_29990 [Prolixibacter sp. NT017]